MEKNLQSNEAITKLQELIAEIKVCIFITTGKSGYHISRPMTVVETDKSGGVWFYTDIRSNKVKDIEVENFVELVFAHPGKEKYLHIKGRAIIVTDPGALAEKWNPVVRAWITDGLNDPFLCLVKVKPDEAHYWNASATKMRAVFDSVVSAITGSKTPSPRTHGELSM